MPKPPRPTGFSLIELLVVLAVVGIIAAVGVTWSSSPVPAAVKSGTGSLVGALRGAQTLALSSGQQVYLQTTGGGTVAPRLDWGFRVLNADGTLNSLGPVQGSWTLTTSEARFLSIGVGNADLTAVGNGLPPKGVVAISSHVLDNTAIWSTTFFTGSSTPTTAASCPFFLGDGTINQEFFTTVTGARSGQVFMGGNRMGLILVSPRSGISSYMKQDPDKTSPAWNRL